MPKETVASQKTIKEIISLVFSHKNSKRAAQNKRYFKTAPGEYGYPDEFIGVSVPTLRKISKDQGELYFDVIQGLLLREEHELRLFALINLATTVEKASEKETLKQAYLLFRKNLPGAIRNWDLIDASAPIVVGRYLSECCQEHERKELLNEMITDESIWLQRVALLSQLKFFIKQGDFSYLKRLVLNILENQQKPHDLIEKASGWMLREMGKKSKEDLVGFLDENHRRMPKVMLRYSLERLDSQIKYKYTKSQ